MMIEPGQEAILVKKTPLSIHGDVYWDIVIGDPTDPANPARQLGGRLGTESIDGDPEAGERGRGEGFLRGVTGISRVSEGTGRESE